MQKWHKLLILVVVGALGTAKNAESDTLSVTGLTPGSNGTVVDNGDGTFMYTPNAGFIGTDLFTYTVDDGNGNTDTATVNVTVILPPEDKYDIFRGLNPLPVPHPSAPTPAHLFTAEHYGGLLAYTRITGVLTLHGRNCTENEAERAVGVCLKIKAVGGKAVLGIFYDPYHFWPSDLPPGDWGRVFSTELMLVQTQFSMIQQLSDSSGIQVKYVMLDHERWIVRGSDADPEPHNSDMDLKYNLFYWLSRDAFPGAQIILYKQWISGAHLTGREEGNGRSPTLYSPQEFNQTLSDINAHRRKVDGRTLSFWLSLGAGWEIVDGTRTWNWELDYPFQSDVEYGTTLGKGPETVILFHHPLDPRTKDGLQRFSEYVRGAHSQGE